MKKRILGFLTLSLFTILNVSAQETFKVMFYNLLNYPLKTAVAYPEDDLELILSDYHSDLFLVCELNNITSASKILNITKTAINRNFEMITAPTSEHMINKANIIYIPKSYQVYRNNGLSANSDYIQQFDVLDLPNGLCFLGFPNQNIKLLKFMISN